MGECEWGDRESCISPRPGPACGACTEWLCVRVRELEDGINGLLALRPRPNNPSRYCCWRYGSDSEQGSHMPQHADNCPYQRAKALLPEEEDGDE